MGSNFFQDINQAEETAADLVKQKDFLGAIKEYNKALKFDSECFPVLAKKAFCYACLGYWKRAWDALDEVQIHPFCSVSTTNYKRLAIGLMANLL